MKQGPKLAAYTVLKERVLKLDLSPGEVLDEVELCREFNLSRTPMREVFQRLSGEGYLALQSNRGASVSSMDLSTMRNFFQSAPMIYAAIGRLAAEHGTADQLNLLKKIQRRFDKAVEKADTRDMAFHNHHFHEQIGVMAASPYLAPSLGRLLIDHTRMSYRFYRTEQSESRERNRLASEQHFALIDAIGRREAAETVALTLQHWELSRSEMDKYVMPDPLPVEHEVSSMGVPG